jgi:acyl carrier protein phosphodiesterase
VALDVLFDHFLWQHWVRFYDVPREQAIAHHYRQLEQGLPLMHGPMQQRVERLIAFDLLNQYGDLTKVGEALDVIAARIRFANSFGGIIEEIGSRYRELEEGFLTFYPQLQAKVRESGLE